MGLSVWLRPKRINYDFSIYGCFSRRFCGFLSGPNVYKNPEIKQLEEILKLDLALFLRRVPNLNPPIEDLNHKLYLAKQKGASETVEQLLKEIEIVEIAWRKEFNENNEGWTGIEEFINITALFKEKITASPEYHKFMKYNHDWRDYFLPERNDEQKPFSKSKFTSTKDYNCTKNILIEDIQEVLNWLTKAKQLDVEYVTVDIS